MKTIGLIGGMSWESTVTYYEILNETIKERLGGLHSAKCILGSVDFAEIEACQSAGRWEESGEILGREAQALERAGAEFLVICTNTMHKVAPQVESAVHIPLLHIADATADELEAKGLSRVGLLGTKYTMTQDFYKDRLLGRGFAVLTPGEEDMDLVNKVIFEELCLGTIKGESRAELLRMIGELSRRGAQGVILGCTELGLLLRQEDTAVPLFDTAQIHARRAALLALTEKNKW